MEWGTEAHNQTGKIQQTLLARSGERMQGGMAAQDTKKRLKLNVHIITSDPFAPSRSNPKSRT